MSPDLWSKLIEGLIQGGPIAILSYIIFSMYRSERKDEAARWESFAKEELACRVAENESRKELAKALTDLTIAVRQVVRIP